MNRLWLIIDCNYLCHRARYSTGSLSYDGNMTGVVYGFLKEIAYLMEYYQTKYVIFCWDSKPNIRQKYNKQYKANRSQTVVLSEEEKEIERQFYLQIHSLQYRYLQMIGFRNNFFQQYYESDDIMASLCLSLPKKDSAVIITADKDLYQMISNKVICYNPQKRHVMSLQLFRNTYNINPDKWALVKAIAGCSSDNIKGVMGVGEKTAIKYLRNELKKDSKAFSNIVAAEKSNLIKRNLRLTRLPFKDTQTFQLRKDKLSEAGWQRVIKELGFKSLKERCPFIKGKTR